jgi:hypothetical protein
VDDVKAFIGAFAWPPIPMESIALPLPRPRYGYFIPNALMIDGVQVPIRMDLMESMQAMAHRAVTRSVIIQTYGGPESFRSAMAGMAAQAGHGADDELVDAIMTEVIHIADGEPAIGQRNKLRRILLWMCGVILIATALWALANQWCGRGP